MLLFGTKYLYLFIIALAVIFFVLQPRKKQKDIVLLSILYLPLAYIVAQVIAYFYFDSRPFVIGHFQPLIPHVADNGFPSDHMLLSTSFRKFCVISTKGRYLLPSHIH
jgi:undecaprenyl-diphosphatase